MRLRVRHRHKVAMAGNSSCDKGFSSSFMVLKPEQVKFVDLIRILFSSDLEKPNFVDSSAQTEESFGRRWLIFLSISVQKALLFTAKPLAAIGSAVEMSLNVLSSNGNLCKLILNSIQGKAVIPGRESADFYSFIGSIDKRPKLDPNIKRGDPKYNAALSMMASKLSYENKAHVQNTVTNHWQMEFLGFYDYWNDYQEKATTQAFMMRDKVGVENDTIVVAFRGTEPFDADAWCSDFDLSWYEIPGVGKIHGGFMKALGLQKNIGFPREIAKEGACSGRPIPLAYYDIRDRLRDLVRQNNATKFVLTGHSLGGALAILFPAILAWHDDKFLLERLEGVYTFGQPRVGNAAFGEFMKTEMVEHNIRYFRFVYGNDMVPRLPYDDKSFMFKHFGTCLYSDRNYLVQVVDEEPNKNYFSPLNAIPMMINSWGELIRSFSIPYKKGPDFSEGGFLRLFRIIGLLMPGVPAHCPQDYVNSTRFVSNDVFLHPIDSSHKNL